MLHNLDYNWKEYVESEWWKINWKKSKLGEIESWWVKIWRFLGKTSEFSPPNERSKEGFFYGAYIEKWGMVFWGESNKEEFIYF